MFATTKVEKFSEIAKNDLNDFKVIKDFKDFKDPKNFKVSNSALSPHSHRLSPPHPVPQQKKTTPFSGCRLSEKSYKRCICKACEIF